jgi:hypothetical protein
MRTGAIQAGVEDLLGHPVAKESVSWTLRHSKTRRFECVAYWHLPASLAADTWAQFAIRRVSAIEHMFDRSISFSTGR